MTQPSSNKLTLLDWLDTQEDNMVTLLKDLVNIDSNSFDKAGVDRVADRLGEFFDEQSIPFETIPIGFFKVYVCSTSSKRWRVVLKGK